MEKSKQLEFIKKFQKITSNVINTPSRALKAIFNVYEDEIREKCIDKIKINIHALTEQVEYEIGRVTVHIESGPMKFRTFCSQNGMDNIFIELIDQLSMVLHLRLKEEEDRIKEELRDCI